MDVQAELQQNTERLFKQMRGIGKLQKSATGTKKIHHEINEIIQNRKQMKEDREHSSTIEIS